MPIRQYRPTSPGRRGMSVSTFEEITKTKPEKSLVVKLEKHSGRNNQGKITVRHRGGGEKRYILAPLGLKVGDRVSAGPDADIKPGNSLPLKNIPSGTVIHNIEL